MKGPAERVLGARVRGPRIQIEFDEVHTRWVLAGAYKGRGVAQERVLLTHLVYRKDDDDIAVGCRQPLDHIVDKYGTSEEVLHSRPTCKACAKKWDRIKGK